MATRLRILELFAGIGGCAAAMDGAVEVVAAVDISRKALAVYARNFPHCTAARAIDTISAAEFADWEADLWWLSPPCQPYTSRGLRQDLDDPRAAGLVNVVQSLSVARPRYLALENVPGFESSRSRAMLLDALHASGYSVRERVLCPSDLGVPNRRRRYFLVAARDRQLPQRWMPSVYRREFTVADILDAAATGELDVPQELLQAYADAVHVVDARDPLAVSHCFTAAYGKSIVHSGSYVKVEGAVRRFSPAEILRLLGFPRSFQLPAGPSAKSLWPLVGNSLSLPAVRCVLSAVPELEGLGDDPAADAGP
jgi:DNA (cytosine-5)-methyltransferase 1